jgi:hypothetical protein
MWGVAVLHDGTGSTLAWQVLSRYCMMFVVGLLVTNFPHFCALRYVKLLPYTDTKTFRGGESNFEFVQKRYNLAEGTLSLDVTDMK